MKPRILAVHNNCGSGLARDSGLSATKDIEFAGLFAGKPAPTGTVGGFESWLKNNRLSVTYMRSGL
jgi:hypothetical protein